MGCSSTDITLTLRFILNTETQWRYGRIDKRSGPRRLLFGQMYEDVAIETAVFEHRPRIFCIASAGCTAISLAATHEVTAVDINPVQLRYARGRANGDAMRTGAAEAVMMFGRKLLTLAGWRRNILNHFLNLNDPIDQIIFWNRHLNTRRFRYELDTMLANKNLQLVYASPFLRSLPQHFGSVMRTRLERCWATHPNRENPYAHSLLLGAAYPNNHSRVTVANIHFVCDDAVSFLEQCAPQSFDGFALSNICDGASEAFRTRLFAALKHVGTKDSVAILRSFSEPDKTTAHNLASIDRSMLWGVVDVRNVYAL